MGAIEESHAAQGVLKKTGPMMSDCTLRDYFAAKAMQALLSNPHVVVMNPISGWSFCNTSSEGISKVAYIQADAMLAARIK